MAGVENILVQRAPTVPPLGTVADEDWVTLEHWQTIRSKGGQVIDDVNQMFNVGTAQIVVRNGDSAGNGASFTPNGSYRGENIRVIFPGQTPDIGVLWLGRIGRVEFDYTQSPFAAYATLHCVDVVGNVADGAVPDDLFTQTVDYFTGVETVEEAFAKVMNQVSPSTTISVEGEFSNQLVKAPDSFDSKQGLLEFLNQVLLTEGAALYAQPNGELVLRGRWEPLRLLNADAADPIVFTDTDPDGETTFRYRRDDLEWSDADEDYANSVQTQSKYLNVLFTDEDVASGYPKIQLSRTELVTIRQGWVEANARMWHTLSEQRYAYPKKLTFLAASRGLLQRSIFTLGATPWPTALQRFEVVHTLPGEGDVITYRLAVDYVEHDINKNRWLCTLGFTSLDRWWFGYGNGTDPIELVDIDGDSDHGIDSDAIIAP